jgi:hypothetical protein
MGLKFTVDSRAFDKEIRRSLARDNSAKVIEQSIIAPNGKILSKEIDEMIKEMVKNFLSLGVTKEILGGPMAQNTSGTLGGYGNLFSFIGFPEGSRPIDPIVGLLQQTSYRFTNLTPRGTMEITITLPSTADIFRATPLPWAPGISWAQRIEVGLSGLGMYMDKPKGRSGGGVQASKKIRTGRFSNSPYISAFLKEWQSKFLKIDKAIHLK